MPVLLWNLYLASFFEDQVTVASGHDSTFLHFFASELSSFLGRNASCCDLNNYAHDLQVLHFTLERGLHSTETGENYA